MGATLATGEPANFSFLADELFRRFTFKRSVSNVRSHVVKHMAELLDQPLKGGPSPSGREKLRERKHLLAVGTVPITPRPASRDQPHPGDPESRGDQLPGPPLGETKQVNIVQQPGSFRVIARPPTPQDPQWPDILAEYRL